MHLEAGRYGQHAATGAPVQPGMAQDIGHLMRDLHCAVAAAARSQPAAGPRLSALVHASSAALLPPSGPPARLRRARGAHRRILVGVCALARRLSVPSIVVLESMRLDASTHSPLTTRSPLRPFSLHSLPSSRSYIDVISFHEVWILRRL